MSVQAVRPGRRSIALTAVTLVVGATAVAMGPAASAGADPAPAPAGTFHTVRPQRLMDTGAKVGASSPGAQGVTTLSLGGDAEIPTTGVPAVVLTVTVVSPAARGYLTVYAAGATRPAISNVNFDAGRTQSNQVYAPVGTGNRISFFNGSSRSVRVLADVTGYFGSVNSTTPGAFVPTTPTRVLDTRSGAPVAARSSSGVPVLGHGGVPASNVTAVVATVTALQPGAGGYLTAYASGTARPPTSTLSFAARQTVGNEVVSQVGADGKVAVYNGAYSATDLIVDVQGYIVGGTPRAQGAYVPITPRRWVSSTIAGRSTAATTGGSATGIPGGAAAASVVDITASRTQESGYAQLNTGLRTNTSGLSFAAARATTGLAVADGGPTQSRLFNGSLKSATFTRDVFGYFANNIGGLDGRVTDATSGDGIAGVTVHAFVVVTGHSEDPEYVDHGTTTTTADGIYRFPILPAGSYLACFDATGVAAPVTDTGYLDECHQHVRWFPNGSIPVGGLQGVTETTVPAGADGTADEALPRTGLGDLAGTATFSSGAPAADIAVDIDTAVPDDDHNPFDATTTNSAGHYDIRLPVGSYRVCGDDANKGSTLYGYSASCASVTVTKGATTTRNLTILAAGGVTGHVTAPTSAQGMAVFAIPVGGANGDESAPVNAAGNYTIPSLDPALTYTICFVGNQTLAGQCYDNKPYTEGDDPPPGTTPVPVHESTLTTVNATLIAK